MASRPAAEIMARMERDPGEIYREFMTEFGAPLRYPAALVWPGFRPLKIRGGITMPWFWLMRHRAGIGAAGKNFPLISRFSDDASRNLWSDFLEDGIDDRLVSFSIAVSPRDGDGLHKSLIKLSADRIGIIGSIETKHFSAAQFFHLGTNHLRRRSLAAAKPISQVELKIRCGTESQEGDGSDFLLALYRDSIQRERQYIGAKRIADYNSLGSVPKIAVMLQYPV